VPLSVLSMALYLHSVCLLNRALVAYKVSFGGPAKLLKLGSCADSTHKAHIEVKRL